MKDAIATLATLISQTADIRIGGFMVGNTAVMFDFDDSYGDNRTRVRLACKAHGHESPYRPDCAGTSTLCVEGENYDEAAKRLLAIATRRNGAPLADGEWCLLTEGGRFAV